MAGNTRFAFQGSLYSYQTELVDKAKRGNTIIHLPTGGGKTVIAAALASIALQKEPQKLVVMLVNRVPLVKQQQAVMERHVLGACVAGVSGEKKDTGSWNDARVRFNIIIIIDSIFWLWYHSAVEQPLFHDIGLLVFDEIHHARKNSYYAKIAKVVNTNQQRTPMHVVGLTASPGADVDPTKTKSNIVDLMKLTGCNIATVVDHRDDLIQRVSVPKCCLEVFELAPTEKYLEDDIVSAISTVENRIVRNPLLGEDFKKRFVCIGMPYGSVQYITSCHESLSAAQAHSEHDVEATVKVLARLNQALLLLTDTGVRIALQYLLENDMDWISWLFQPLTTIKQREAYVHKLLGETIGTWWYQLFVKGAQYASAAPESGTKLELLIRLITRLTEGAQREKDFRCIVFCQTKRASDQIVRRLLTTDVALLNPCYFVGHSKSVIDDGPQSQVRTMGMTDSQQQARLAEFREGTVRLLVATSVAEEGLDIPNCNVIIRYDGELTVKSFIQTRGRARKRNSEYYAIMRRGDDANTFRRVVESVQQQEQIVMELSISPPPGLAAPTAAPPASQASWQIEPVMALDKLRKRRPDLDMDQQVENERLQGKRVTMALMYGATDSDGTQAFYRVTSWGIGQENVARRIAAGVMCQRLCDLGLGDLLDQGAADTSKAASIRTAAIHNRQHSVAVASVRGVNRNDPSALAHGERPRGSQPVNEYDPTLFTSKHPYEVLVKYCLEKRCAYKNPLFSEELGVADDNQRITATVEYQVLTVKGERMWSQQVGYGRDRRHALGNAAIRALNTDCGREQVLLDAGALL
jgi:endoribonuclease Dicer